jgi:2-amino-4-hydroxy-6-hydroxymethyldihydropteridine diphosphokinase
MPGTNRLYLLTGSNIEPRFSYLNSALNEIAQHIGVIATASSVFESEPWGFDSSGKFLNQVVLVHTSLSPEKVLKTILTIEKDMGRTRQEGAYTSRTIDIDILYYNDEQIDDTGLTIPHPRLHERRFTLLPLVEIAADLVHPVLQMKNIDLLAQCPDNSTVGIYTQHD